MIFTDRLTLDAPKYTKEGYMAVRARAARSGLYDYLGAEVDPTGKHANPDDRVTIYRDTNEVFSERAVRSFIMKPVTNDHPSTAVTADNWKDHAKGVVAGAMRDGDYLAFDLVLMDKAAIADVQSGKRELSNGYEVDLDWTPGVTADGQKYDARQVGIVGNHVALVDRGRAGSECRIADGAALCDTLPRNLFTGDVDMTTRTITVDGIKVTMDEQSAAIVEKALAGLDAARADLAKAQTDLATAQTDIATKDAEIATLKTQVADATSPAKMAEAVRELADATEKARAIIGDKLVTDGKSAADIRKQVVDAKLGDVAKGWTDAQVSASFAALTVSVPATDNLAAALADRTNVSDAGQRSQADYVARMTGRKAA